MRFKILRPKSSARNAELVARVRRLHARLPDGTCSCDAYFKRWADCPTAILLHDTTKAAR